MVDRLIDPIQEYGNALKQHIRCGDAHRQEQLWITINRTLGTEGAEKVLRYVNQIEQRPYDPSTTWKPPLLEKEEITK